MDITKDVTIKVNGKVLAAFDNFCFEATAVHHQFKEGLWWSEEEGPEKIKKVMAGLHPRSYYRTDGSFYNVYAFLYDAVNIKFDVFGMDIKDIYLGGVIVVSIMNETHTVYVESIELYSYDGTMTISAAGTSCPTPIGA